MYSLISDTNKKSTGTAGFALFYSVVVVAVISSLGAVLSSLIVREADLSATARQSSRAYYSADAGLECAQYWDLQEGVFSGATSPDIECSNQSTTTTGTTYDEDSDGNEDDEKYKFSINSGNICVDVKILKYDDGGREITQIDAVGSDTCGSTRVQRALRTTY